MFCLPFVVGEVRPGQARKKH